MIAFLYYDPATGTIVGRGQCQDEHFPPVESYGLGVIAGQADAGTHRVDVTADPPEIVPA